MSKTVILEDVVEAFEFPENWQVYLDKKTGKILLLTEDDQTHLSALDGEPEDPDEIFSSDSVQEYLSAEKNGELISFPDRFDINEWDIMKRFCLSVANGSAQKQLLNAIHVSGAFRYFKDTVHRLELADQWDQYRNDALERFAIEWLESVGMSWVRRKPRNNRNRR
jgi:hypothetical protein